MNHYLFYIQKVDLLGYCKLMILITVGTTSFDGLIKSVDLLCPNYGDILIQLADGDYLPNNYSWFRYDQDIDKLYDEAEIIVCHAGAGTIYKLLEKKKKIIVVPNLDRADVHQREIAEFVEINNYGLVCWDLSDLSDLLLTASSFNFNYFAKKEFFAKSILNNLLSKYCC